MTTLDVQFHSVEAPELYLFFKQLGVAISKAPDVENGAHYLRSTEFSLRLNTISGLKNVPIVLDIEQIETVSEGFLYFKSHDAEQILKLKKVMDSVLTYRVYYLCHNFLDIRSEFEKLQNADIDLTRITFLVTRYGQVQSLHSNKTVQDLIKGAIYNEIIFVNPYLKPKTTSLVESKSGMAINIFFIMRLFKIVLAPGYFFKRQIEILQVSNFVWFLRFHELFQFIYFIAAVSVFKMYGFGVDIFYLVRVGFIRALFGIRHLILMTGFKSFGIFVDGYQIARSAFNLGIDAYNFTSSHIKIFFIRSLFFIRHLLLMTMYKTYGFCVDIFYFAKASGIQLFNLFRHLIYHTSTFIRHCLIMAAIRTFYFVKDTVILLWIHRYLMYPFYKSYWFTSFQYRKRIKKESI
ncbi:MAG: hypothetical protein H7256_07785 [Bdellovibrio sp.]|nr:hypothetical protein [Bdellovibrio sp.]